jgi:plasmid stability protein
MNDPSLPKGYLSLRNIPSHVMGRLHIRAMSNGRSLAGELRALLYDAVGEPLPETPQFRYPMKNWGAALQGDPIALDEMRFYAEETRKARLRKPAKVSKEPRPWGKF